MAINANARERLIGGGIIDYLFSIGGEGVLMLLRKMFKTWSAENFDIPMQFANRGLDDFNIIKEHGFRDDGLAYWEAIKKYVRGILEIYYSSDQMLQEDWEIQNWISDVKVCLPKSCRNQTVSHHFLKASCFKK